MAKQATPQGTWAIQPPVRRILARTVLELRTALEDDFRRQLRAVGIHEDGLRALPAGRTLTPAEQHLFEIAGAVINREAAGGSTEAQAFETYVRDSAFTFLNRMVGLRCLEERELLFVDGQTETAIKVDPARNASSLYWRVRNELGPQTQPREIWRETLRRAGAAISERVKVLFDPESEYAALLPLPPALQQIIDALNSPSIPSSVCAEDEFLGWIYQYYNASEKDAAYAGLAKGKKLEQSSELIAATCLYTERYMVDYLLQNTLGTLWVEMHPESKLPEHWPYFVHTPENEITERPMRPLRDIAVLDPACGSGHFLVRAFDLLVQMYQEEGREAEDEIPHLIIERNLHGIDIDLRAVQIAALGLFLKACALAGPSFQPRQLNLLAADALLPGDEPPAEYMAKLKADPLATAVVRSIWPGLKHVREVGSLLHPERELEDVVRRQRQADPLRLRDDAYWEQWKSELLKGLEEEFESQAESEDLGQRLFGREAAKGVGLVEALGRKYDVTVMNPPYAGSGNLNARLKAFIEREHKEGKRDLYAAFIQRCRDFAKPGGFVGMVTQQSWLFLRTFAALRKEALQTASVDTLAHLGPRAFEEISGEVVNIALFTLRESPPQTSHRFTAFRLIGSKSAVEKDSLLRRAVAGGAAGVISTPRQTDFISIPETPFVYWLRPRFLELLRSRRRLKNVADVCQGLRTTDNERFLRYVWEVPEFGGRWFSYSKGGHYQKWFGLNRFAVDFLDDGQAIKDSVARKYPYLKGKWEWVIGSRDRYFQAGLCYSCNCRGSLGLRSLRVGSIFDPKGPGIFPKGEASDYLLGLLSTRPVSYLLRATVPVLDFNPGYVAAAPIEGTDSQLIARLTRLAVELKAGLVACDPTEMTFGAAAAETKGFRSLGVAATGAAAAAEAQAAALHTIEAAIERLAVIEYGLDDADVKAMVEETGCPAGWYELISGFDRPPAIEDVTGLGAALAAEVAAGPSGRNPSERLKDRIRALYQAGPGAAEKEDTEEILGVGNSDEEGEAELGAHVPVPTETFLEEISVKTQIHPISVYRLIDEMREKEGLTSGPLMKQAIEEFTSLTTLRLLGYRWPEQDAYESAHDPVLDSTLGDDDGIIPLVRCGDHPTAVDLVQSYLERHFGAGGLDQSEQEFRQWVGCDIGEWLRRDFFRGHLQQFKQRPIAWHLVSPDRTFQAFVLYHKLSRATLQRLRGPQYAGGLITRLKGEQERARQRSDGAEVNRLQLQIEDVEEFCERIEKIERGDELKYRIRCRWKDEEKDGRPGPYAPDIDDGVKVNIRPFQEAGLLAVKEVIKKW